MGYEGGYDTHHAAKARSLCASRRVMQILILPMLARSSRQSYRRNRVQVLKREGVYTCNAVQWSRASSTKSKAALFGLGKTLPSPLSQSERRDAPRGTARASTAHRCHHSQKDELQTRHKRLVTKKKHDAQES